MVLIGYHASGTVQWTQEEGAGVLLLAQELSVARHAAIYCPPGLGAEGGWQPPLDSVLPTGSGPSLTFSGLEPKGQAPGWDSLGPSSAYSCFPLQDGRQRPEAREGFGYPSLACVPASPVPFFI